MSQTVRLASLGPGVPQDSNGNVIVGRKVYVVKRDAPDTTVGNQIQVYSDEAGTVPLNQPLSTDGSGIPGFVVGAQSVDFIDALSIAPYPDRMQVEIGATVLPTSAVTDGRGVAAYDVLVFNGTSFVRQAMGGNGQALVVESGALAYTPVATGKSHGIYSAVTDGGITPNSAVVGNGAAINTWLASLPLGSTALFPAVSGSPSNVTKYWVDQTIIVPAGVKLDMGGLPYAPTVGSATSVFAVMTASWTGANVVVANGAMTSNVQAATGCTNWQPAMHNVTVDLEGGNNFTAFALIHPTELSDIDGLIVDPNLSGVHGTGNIGFLLISNGDTAGNPAGIIRMKRLQTYGLGYTNLIVCDATNNGQITAGNWAPIFGIELQFTGGTIGAVSDSPIKCTGCDQVEIIGLHQAMPPENTQDTAGIRLIDCGLVTVRDYWYEFDNRTTTRPFIKATKTGGAPSAMPVAAPRLLNVRFYGSGGWAARTDASCGLTSGNTTITDASIAATDLYRPVYGPGIPSGAYVASVTAGTSFTVQSGHAPFLTGTVSLTIGANVIEDETTTIRHFQYHATYFAPLTIQDYSGARCEWIQGPASSPSLHIAESESKNTRNLIAPTNSVGETFSRMAAPSGTAMSITSGTLYVVQKVLYPGDTVTNLNWLSSTTALATGTHQWAALFDPAENLLAISADGTSGAWAASSVKAFAMGTAYTVSLPAQHYLGLMVAATTPPTLASFSNGATAIAPIPVGATSSTGLTTPSTCPNTAAISTTTNVPYAYIT